MRYACEGKYLINKLTNLSSFYWPLCSSFPRGELKKQSELPRSLLSPLAKLLLAYWGRWNLQLQDYLWFAASSLLGQREASGHWKAGREVGTGSMCTLSLNCFSAVRRGMKSTREMGSRGQLVWAKRQAVKTASDRFRKDPINVPENNRGKCVDQEGGRTTLLISFVKHFHFEKNSSFQKICKNIQQKPIPTHPPPSRSCRRDGPLPLSASVSISRKCERSPTWPQYNHRTIRK